MIRVGVYLSDLLFYLVIWAVGTLTAVFILWMLYLQMKGWVEERRWRRTRWKAR
jgi:hypothetical protein